MNWFQRAKRTLSASSTRMLDLLNGSVPLSGVHANARSDSRRRKLGFEPLEARLTLAAAGLVPVGSQPAGPLTGKIVFVSPGHGDQYDVSGQWYLGRSETQEMNEALGTQDQATFFADYLFRAGATVVPLRPIGRQTNEVVLDNDMTEVTYTGAWSNNTTGPKWYDENYGAGGDDAIKYRFSSISAGETATATYTPNIAASGFYPVYAWATPGANRTNQLYKINHSGGETQVRIDHRQVGNGWVYLGTYHFDSGTAGSVVISNQSTAGGSVVIADAIRFGNGMGDVPDGPNGAGQSGGTLSDKPREDEAALLWCYRSIGQGAGNLATFFGVTGNDPNVNAPARLAEYMYENTNTFGTGVYISIHSNAFDGTGRGAIGLITNSGSPTPHQSDLATWLGQQVNEDLRGVDQDLGFTWSTRTTYTLTGGYGEFNADDFTNSSGVVEMDASLAEVAFHDNAADALIMRDPRGRDAIARALYHAVVQYFDVWGGLASPATLPTAPVNVRAVSNTSGQVTLNWSAGPTSSAYGAAATGYRIYMSADGYGFDGGTAVAGGGTTSTTITGLDPNLPYYFKVVATNAGGESLGSEVLTALPGGGEKQVLIVNGFDRYHQSQDFRYTTRQDTGTNITVDRVWSRYNNSFDYVVQVHSAIHASKPGVHVASTSNEAVISGAVNLTDYDAVIWILGTESDVDDTFNATEQTKVQQFIAAGGHLFLSGSEIAWDLDDQNNGRTFFENTLKGNYVTNDAGTYTATADAGGIFAGMSSFAFSNGSAFSQLDTQLYNVDAPDVIAAQAGALAALTYSGGTGGTAAIQVEGTGGAGNIVMFAFPFEAMTSETRRNTAMGRVLDFFGVVVGGTPAVDIKTRVDGQDADSPTGPILAAGGTATFTYEVTNTGNIPLSSVAVGDDNGTPGVPGDDFAPSFTSGDTNSNNLLDVTETWTYTAIRTAVAGQYSNIGSVAAVGNSMNVSDGDAANYFGSAPQVSLETFVEEQDADSPTGPVFAAGNMVAFTYVLTNTGNIAVSIVLKDSNGTPTIIDDFTPSFSGGDTNGNNMLDLAETWTYSTSREAIIGQYEGEGQATATDSISQSVFATDATHYFGAVADISIETLVNGDEADSPPGPSLNAGNTATFTYMVTNAGNIALGSVTVTDDNGTPGNTADDFNPTYVDGDTNTNELLDTDETWTYSAMHTVTVGQYTNQGSVTASDITSQVAANVDAANHLGVAVPIENADFNADSVVDAADYVVWRKFSGMTVPAGTLGDANNDTNVNEDDNLIFESQFGESTGGSSSLLGGASGGNDDTASQDAAFSALSAGMTEPKWLGYIARPSRPAYALQARRITAVNDDWPALLSAIAEQRAHHGDGEDLEVLGSCGVGLRETLIKPAEPDRALAKLLNGTKSAIARVTWR